jgi:acyl phosphate:glycerol-3-phosphate acyltransferase
MFKIFISVIMGYLFGSFQTSYILGKVLRKGDIRNYGYGNAGASNTAVSFGLKYGILVAIVDILKAVLSIMFIKYLFRTTSSTQYFAFLLYLNCIFIILGHNFPFYMKFKGGKGTASLIGALIVLDIKLAVIGILAIVIVTLITKYIAIGTMSLVSSFVIATIYYNYSIYCIAIAVLIALMSLIKHLPNIKRIINGTETKLQESL